MTTVARQRLEIRQIPVGDLAPNTWNPNVMDEATLKKLRLTLERDGFVEPLVVRPHEGAYQLLGGYHRWMTARELGYETVPCVVLEVDDRRAKILTVNLNELKGQPVPSLLAELVHDLSHDVSFDDLATQLPYDVEQLEDLSELLRIPEGFEEELEAEADRLERERPRVLSFALAPDQCLIVEEAVDRSLQAIAGTSRGAALTHLAQSFLEGGETE